MSSLQEFIDEWTNDTLATKPVFLSFYNTLSSLDDADITFQGRPGITYSLRSTHHRQKDRPLFVMIDVIDDDPRERWLSVCFYGDMITDPEEHGDLIPEGLLGSDGHCFDISERDDQLVDYVRQRIHEAYQAAANA